MLHVLTKEGGHVVCNLMVSLLGVVLGDDLLQSRSAMLDRSNTPCRSSTTCKPFPNSGTACAAEINESLDGNVRSKDCHC